MTRKTNAAGKQLIREFEAERLKAYLDGGGVPTIGVGHTKGVHMGMVISPAQSDAFLSADMTEAEEGICRHVKVALTDNQYAALVCWTFNIGVPKMSTSTLVTRLNKGDYNCVPRELIKWRKDNGKDVAGLLRRRIAEGALWSKDQAPVNTSSMNVTVNKPTGSLRAKIGTAITTGALGSDQVFALVDKGEPISATPIGKYVIGALTIIGIGLMIYGIFAGHQESKE